MNFTNDFGVVCCEHAGAGGQCRECSEFNLPDASANDDHWGYCDHGVSLSPAVDCPACEVREVDADA